MCAMSSVPLALQKPRERRADLSVEHHEQQHQRNAGDDLRVDDGHIADGHDGAPGALIHAADADGGQRAHHGGDARRRKGHAQRNA